MRANVNPLAVALIAGLLCATVLLGTGVQRYLALAGPAPVELVVAHYSEQLKWLEPARQALPAGARVTIYSKSWLAPPDAVRLPNVGREAHTYLYHLVHRYNSLADVTLFVMGSADANDMKNDMLRRLLVNWTQAIDDGFTCPGHQGSHAPPRNFSINAWQGTTDPDWEDIQPAHPRPLSAWFEQHVGGAYPCTWCVASMMAVSRERVHRRPRRFYEGLLQQVAVGANPEVGHYLERSWVGIFRNPNPQLCMPPVVW